MLESLAEGRAGGVGGGVGWSGVGGKFQDEIVETGESGAVEDGAAEVAPGGEGSGDGGQGDGGGAEAVTVRGGGGEAEDAAADDGEGTAGGLECGGGLAGFAGADGGGGDAGGGGGAEVGADGVVGDLEEEINVGGAGFSVRCEVETGGEEGAHHGAVVVFAGRLQVSDGLDGVRVVEDPGGGVLAEGVKLVVLELIGEGNVGKEGEAGGAEGAAGRGEDVTGAEGKIGGLGGAPGWARWMEAASNAGGLGVKAGHKQKGGEDGGGEEGFHSIAGPCVRNLDVVSMVY